ncbi:MAG: class I SAM-dependent methyltransferase [Clostridia bacterium]|nr:class I SAM-dependent methyltransferase [Clostridia bacterium]
MAKDFIELSKKWFDKQAPVYDETNTILYSKNGKISCENIFDFLKDIEYEKLLDIGCGTGYLIDMLAKNYEAEFTGLDLSPEMVKQANNKNIKNAKFVEGRSDEIPFEDNTFNIVTCSQSFHHYPDTDKAMQEARRVLKPGGLYILSDTGVGPFKILGVKIDDFIYRHFSNTGDCNVSYMEKTIRDMERNGFMIVKAEKITTFIYTVIGKKIQ